MSEVYLKKIVVLGEPAVGKMSLYRRYATGNVIDDYYSTSGVGVIRKDMRIGDKTYVFQIWVLQGGSKYEAKRRKGMYRGATGAIIVFDVHRPETFEKLEYWIEELKQTVGPIPFVICGNKVDVEGRKVSKTQAEAYAQHMGAPYFDTSAKTGEGLEPAVVWLGQQSFPPKD